jgi:hypothetical protein
MTLKQLFGLSASSLTEQELFNTLHRATEHEHRVNYFSVPRLGNKKKTSLRRRRVRLS